MPNVTQLIIPELGFEPESFQTHSPCGFSNSCLFHIGHRIRKMRVFTACLIANHHAKPSLPKFTGLDCNRTAVSTLIYFIPNSKLLRLFCIDFHLSDLVSLCFPVTLSNFHDTVRNNTVLYEAFPYYCCFKIMYHLL